MITCASCHTTVPSGRFCAVCGAALPQPAAAPAPAQVHTAPVPPAAPMTYAPPPAAGWPQVVPQQQPMMHAAIPAQPMAGPSYGGTILPGPPAVAPVYPQPVPVLQPLAYAHHDVRSGKRTTGVGVVVAGALAVAAYFLFGHGATHTLSATLSLSDSSQSSLSPGDSCEGVDGYRDVQPGTEMVLEDGDGKTVATANLSDGEFDGDSCVFHFSFSHVPKRGFYVIKSTNSNRGEQRYSFKDMVDQHWSADLTLGGD